ncbi:carotenoid oxygenase family protein [uncultured Brevundimonas sp.]|uniref:carotenoid oxygenase family protein n=1 Tax=uncultured Brevundimonas sp. TaxID=213418 RepID=UPI00261942F5|nr:carotenoid oxygenase family protein [uncultured Brevundimonas sp.]
MDFSRRSFLGASAAMAAASVLTPDRSFARAALDQAHNWELATADVAGDVAPRMLELVHGRVPAGLKGTLYRNGPAQFRRPGGSAQHWFDGDGMVRRWHIEDGQVQLTARFADTRKRRQEEEAGAMLMPGFGTLPDPRARIGSSDDVNPANTSVHKVGDKLWALWEAGSPVVLDPVTLETQDYMTFRPDLKAMPFLAHPRIEPDGTIWNLGLNGRNAIVWHLSPEGSLRAAEMIELPMASYVHDFSATARHLVILLQPWVHTRNIMPLSAAYEWKPELGSKVLVIDKDDLSQRRIFDLPPMGFFHVGDAWEEADGTIRFDVAAHPDMAFAARGASDILNGVPLDHQPAHLGLVVLGTDGRGRLESTGVIAEFPRSDPRRAGLARRFCIHTTGSRDGTPLASAIGVTDWASGRTRSFSFGADHIVDEMVYVPKTGATAEEDAWLIGPSVNLKAGVSELHLLDLARVEDGPVCTWRADVALPAAFHGNWV